MEYKFSKYLFLKEKSLAAYFLGMIESWKVQSNIMVHRLEL